jgi:hypothetical protein
MSFDLTDVHAVPVEEGVPNFRATAEHGHGPLLDAGTSGEDGAGKRRRVFGGRKDAPGPTLKTVKPSPPRLTNATKKTLEELYAGIGGMLLPFDEVCGQVIIDAAPHCAETVYLAAQQNDALRRFVISMTQTSIYGALLIAHMPILMAVAAHHSKNPTVKLSAFGAMGATKMMAPDTIARLKEEMNERGEDTE